MTSWMKFRFGWGLFELFALVPFIIFGGFFNIADPNGQMLALGQLLFVTAGMITGMGAILYQIPRPSDKVPAAPLGRFSRATIIGSIVVSGLFLFAQMSQKNAEPSEAVTVSILLGVVLGSAVGIAICYVWQGIKSLFKHLS